MQVMNHTDLRALFDQQHQASRRQVEVPLVVRRERLLRIQKLLEEHGVTLAAAVQLMEMGKAKRPLCIFAGRRMYE